MRPKNTIAAERARTEPKPAGRRATSSASDTAATRERRAAAQPAPPAKLEPIQVREGVVSLNGYGVRIAVDKGHLLLADGIGSNRRAGKFSRATCGIKRLVVRGSAFFITGDALAWLADIGASFLNLGFDGEILAAWSPPGHDDARLRRAQALAAFTDTGRSVTKHLLREKMLGQLHNLERFFSSNADAISTVRAHLDALEVANDAVSIRYAEAKAADAYWTAWERVELLFIRKDASRIPDHWRYFNSRLSAVTGRPNRASNPANALLNYLYALLEHETRIACQVVGLDAGMGFFHTDHEGRQSLALDLMEPVRPLVDAWLHAQIQSRVWTWDDFAEIREGACRVLPPLTHALAETAPQWANAVAPVVEHVARVLHDTQGSLALPSAMNVRFSEARSSADRRPFATRLTHANRQRAGSQHREPSTTKRAAPKLNHRNACRNCGVILEDEARKYCDDCLPHVQAETQRRMRERGLEAQRRMREAGINVQQDPDLRASKSVSMRALRAAVVRWEDTHDSPTDEQVRLFRETVIPALRAVKQGVIASASHLSVNTVWAIRSGRRIPHPMHWEALAKLAGVDFNLPERNQK